MLDMNYIVNILGQKTKTNLTTNGILMHNAQKTHRATLDFKQGCKRFYRYRSRKCIIT